MDGWIISVSKGTIRDRELEQDQLGLEGWAYKWNHILESKGMFSF